jgi:hypothetical protein
MSGSASSGHRRQLNEEKKSPAHLSAITAAFAKALDAAGLMGSGTPPTPRGLANVSGVQSITNGAAGATQSSIKWANLIAAWSAIRAADGPVPTAAIMAPRALTGYAALVEHGLHHRVHGRLHAGHVRHARAGQHHACVRTVRHDRASRLHLPPAR